MERKRRKVWLIARRDEAAVEWVREFARENGLHLSDGNYAERHYASMTAGLGAPLATVAPLRAPHHSISVASMLGTLKGHIWRAGEIALSHGGVLYLDDATEFRAEVLSHVEDAWRHGYVRLYANISKELKALGADEHECNRLLVPTCFSLVVSTLPCPCGNRGAPRAPCPCTDRDIEKFHAKVRPLVADAEVVRL